MKRIVKGILAVSLSLVLFVASNIDASAAALKDLFDAKYYSSLYPDLKAAFGNDEEALYNHYLTFGIKEGRSASRVFNVKKYRETYADLDAVYGDNWEGYADHYLAFGIKEGRDGGGDGVNGMTAYEEQYSDIYAAFGATFFSELEKYDTLGKTKDYKTLVEPYYQARKAMTADDQDENTRAALVERYELAEKALWHTSWYYIAYLNATNDDLKDSFGHLYNSSYKEYVTYRDYVLLNGTKEDCEKWYDSYHEKSGEHGVSKGFVLPESVMTSD